MNIFLVFVPIYKFKIKILFIASMTENHNFNQSIDDLVHLMHLKISVIFKGKCSDMIW